MPRSLFVIGKQETKRFNLIHCCRCNKKFKQGDKIFSTINKTARRYHFRCAEECNLMPEISN